MTPLLAADLAAPSRLQRMYLQIEAGQKIALIGPNGSGKTTLLRLLAGVDGDAGSIRLENEPLAMLSPARRAQLLAFLPASRDVRWPIPVRDVVALGLAKPDPARVDELLDHLRLTELAERPIDRLSTGERARALLARALAARPRLLLLDEPLSNLDPAWVLRTLDLLDEVANEGCGIALALHDLSLINRFDRVWMLDHGRLVADLPPEELIASPYFASVFEVEPAPTGWTLRPLADRRSSP
jgi:iron complex transport system ATP-binding protein